MSIDQFISALVAVALLLALVVQHLPHEFAKAGGIILFSLTAVSLWQDFSDGIGINAEWVQYLVFALTTTPISFYFARQERAVSLAMATGVLWMLLEITGMITLGSPPRLVDYWHQHVMLYFPLLWIVLICARIMAYRRAH